MALWAVLFSPSSNRFVHMFLMSPSSLLGDGICSASAPTQAHCFHFWRRNLSFLEPSSHILIALINGEGIEGFFNQWEDLRGPLTVFRLPSMRAINSISWVAGNPRDLTRLTRVLCVSAQYPLYTNYRSCCGVVGWELQYLAVEMPPDYWFSLENCI